MPAKKKTEEPAILTPATPTDCVKALIVALGHDPAEVVGVEVNGKYARVYGKDRSLRSHMIGLEWRKAEDADE